MSSVMSVNVWDTLEKNLEEKRQCVAMYGPPSSVKDCTEEGRWCDHRRVLKGFQPHVLTLLGWFATSVLFFGLPLCLVPDLLFNKAKNNLLS